MIPNQKTTSAVAEESLCDQSESGTGEGTETGHTMTSSEDTGDISRVKFIEAEELAVRRARRLVAVGFVLSAVTVSIVVFFFAKNTDKLAFESEVRKDAATTFHSLGIKM
jgi:hypothetical protein